MGCSFRRRHQTRFLFGPTELPSSQPWSRPPLPGALAPPRLLPSPRHPPVQRIRVGPAWPGCKLPEPCLRHPSAGVGPWPWPRDAEGADGGVTRSCPRGWLGKDVLACASQVSCLPQRKTHFAPQPPGFWPQPPRRRRTVQQPPQREWAGGCPPPEVSLWPPNGWLFPVSRARAALCSWPRCASWLAPLQRHPLRGAHLCSGPSRWLRSRTLTRCHRLAVCASL